DADIDGAPDQLAGDLGGREEPHDDIGHGGHFAQIGARAARAVDGEARVFEHGDGLFLNAALGGEREHDGAAHEFTSASRRSTQTAQRTAGISSGAPRGRSRRLYCPPEMSTSPPAPVTSKVMPV